MALGYVEAQQAADAAVVAVVAAVRCSSMLYCHLWQCRAAPQHQQWPQQRCLLARQRWMSTCLTVHQLDLEWLRLLCPRCLQLWYLLLLYWLYLLQHLRVQAALRAELRAEPQRLEQQWLLLAWTVWHGRCRPLSTSCALWHSALVRLHLLKPGSHVLLAGCATWPLASGAPSQALALALATTTAHR